MKRELDPIAPAPENFWGDILSGLAENPECIRHVLLLNPKTHFLEGDFWTSLAKDGDRVYVQIEMASDKVGEMFSASAENFGWLAFPGGIFRIPISSLLI